MNKDNIFKYLLMVQVCDSTFPIGTFNHSYGMETYLRENKINNSQDFSDWLKAYLNTQFYYSEGLLLKACYEKLPQNIDEVWNLDSLITHSTQSRETRDGTRMVANQMISLIQLLYPI
ncbi:urease accessory protein UreF, partial [Enterococcus faecium]|nr:urease accessory protein UreF [Enterococcus faecium]